MTLGHKCYKLSHVPNDLAAYFRTLTNERSVRAIALRAGLDPSTANRQLNGQSTLTIETVVAICRAYDLDFAEVFVAVGFITEAEARSFSRKFALSQIPDAELTREIVRRLDAGRASAVLTEPVSPELVQEVLDEKDPEDDIPYIGRLTEKDLPEKRAADKKPRVGDEPAD